MFHPWRFTPRAPKTRASSLPSTENMPERIGQENVQRESSGVNKSPPRAPSLGRRGAKQCQMNEFNHAMSGEAREQADAAEAPGRREGISTSPNLRLSLTGTRQGESAERSCQTKWRLKRGTSGRHFLILQARCLSHRSGETAFRSHGGRRGKGSARRKHRRCR